MPRLIDRSVSSRLNRLNVTHDHIAGPEVGARSARLLASSRLRRRALNKEGAYHRAEKWFEIAILSLYVTLLYKLVAAGVILTVGVGIYGLMLRQQRWGVNLLGATLTIAYAALATVTAFLVSTNEGLARTAQFLLVMAATIAICKYLAGLGRERRLRFVLNFTWLNVAVLVHVILYHLAHGKWTTWKYLYDTKFIFSVLIVAVAALEDEITARGGRRLWFTIVGGLSVAVLLSGERKAYLLLTIVFLLTKSRLTTKSVVVSAAIALAASLFFFAPNSYLARQVGGGRADASELSNRYFLSVANIGDQSDYIRTFVNRNADRLFHQHPLLGVGATGYLRWARETYGSTLLLSRGLSMNVHGERHRVPAENGVIGIIIVLLYLLAIFQSVFGYNIRNGRMNKDAFGRSTIYGFAFLVCYIYGEAMDTTMLLMILIVGFWAASLDSPKSGSLRSSFHARQARLSA